MFIHGAAPNIHTIGPTVKYHPGSPQKAMRIGRVFNLSGNTGPEVSRTDGEVAETPGRHFFAPDFCARVEPATGQPRRRRQELIY